VLQNELDKEEGLSAWSKDKLRYDYDPVLGDLIVRMPQPVHCELAEGIQALILEKIKLLQKELKDGPEDLLHAIGQIRKGSTGDLTLAGGGKKSPDASFRYKGEKWQTCVVEVGNSETSPHLRKSAHSYVRRTGGVTRTIITFDLDYQNPNQKPKLPSTTRAATYSLYRRKQTEGILGVIKVVKQKHFRLQDPNASTPEGALVLHISDFCPDNA
jgi:hypothetical protein